MMSLSRRHLMLTGAAGAALVTTPARAADGRLLFDIYREDQRVGTHEVRMHKNGERIETDIDIDIQVKLAFVTVYRYKHTNREVYEGDRLLQMSSRTNNNGDKLAVDVQRNGDELVIDGVNGQVRAPGDLFPTTYWQPRSIKREAWIDSQNGKIVESTVRKVGMDRIRYEGRTIECRRYALRGELDCDLWYGPEGWAKLAFEVQGNRIQYRRREESDVASLPQAVAS